MKPRNRRADSSLPALPTVELVATAASAAQLMRGLLHDVAPADPLTFVFTVGLLIGVAVLASFIPAWRASQVDPVVVLKGE